MDHSSDLGQLLGELGFFASLSTVFVSSALGSVHCVGMCGPIIALSGRGTRWQYHLGRLLGYWTIGVCLSLVGRGFFGLLFGKYAAWASFLFLSLVLTFFISNFLRRRRIQVNLPSFLATPMSRIAHHTRQLIPKNSYLLGLSSSFLPCSWLYAYLLAAFGGSDIFYATLIIFAFWLGTLPHFIYASTLWDYFRKIEKAWIPYFASFIVVFSSIGIMSFRVGQFMTSCH